MDVKQRVEIISSDLDALKAEVEQGGGGGDLSAYLTKSEASSTYETQTAASSALALKADVATTYTKSEVDEAIASAGGDVIVDGENVKTKNAWASAIGILIGKNAGSGYNNYQIAIGTNSAATNPTMANWPIAIGYQAHANGSGIVIGSNSNDNGSNTNLYKSIILGWNSNANSHNNVILGHHLTAAADNQVILGHSNETSNTPDCFIVGNGTNTNPSNLVEITTPFKVSSAGIEVNGASYGSVSYNMYSSMDYIPTDANFVACEVPYSQITKLNDFILLKEFSPNTYAIRFTYSQGTTSNTFFYKGSVVNPGSNTLETYVVEIGPDNDLENTLVRLIGKYSVNPTT